MVDSGFTLKEGIAESRRQHMACACSRGCGSPSRHAGSCGPLPPVRLSNSTHAHMLARLQITYTYMQSRKHARTRTHNHTHTRAHLRAYIHARAHIHTHTHTHIHTHILTHANTHTTRQNFYGGYNSDVY